MFAQLEAMFPGRVDLGVGRASGGTTVDIALQRDRTHPAQADYRRQLTEMLAWLYDEFPDDHPFSGVPVMPSVPEVPQTWLFGSNLDESNLAAGLGIGYTFAASTIPRTDTSDQSLLRPANTDATTDQTRTT